LDTNTKSSSSHWKLVVENGKDLVPTPVSVEAPGIHRMQYSLLIMFLIKFLLIFFRC
jgi:hypothetical protein